MSVQALRRRLLPALALLTFIGLPSCIAVVPHAPNNSLVEEQGIEAVTERLTKLLKTSTAPAFTDVEVDEEMMRLRAYNWAGWGWGWGAANPVQGYPVPWQTVTKLEVYENSKVFIYRANQPTMEITFATLDYATEFVDHVASMRQHAMNGN